VPALQAASMLGYVMPLHPQMMTPPLPQFVRELQ
jgi:hypothetical protein